MAAQKILTKLLYALITLLGAGAFPAMAQITPGDPGNFITIWKSDNSGNTMNHQIRIPTTGSGYNYDLYWEDVNDPGINDTISGLTGGFTVIDFPEAGTYRVEISGNFPRIYFNNQFDRQKILSVEQWGNIEWASMERAFAGTWNLEINATDAPDLSGVTSMSGMFDNARSINSDLNHWDVSNVQDMSALFSLAVEFNGDISGWVTDNVTDMSNMFHTASEFNGDISNWETGNVTDMSSMFYRAGKFNGDISDWDTGSVENMSSMFREATVFNQNIGGWITNNVENMSYMFYQATNFDQNIGGWNTGNVENMNSMFYEATAFNQDLNNWETGSVTDMRSIFQDATSFDGDISGWDIGNVSNMSNMFFQAASFNKDISGWNTSGVTSMYSAFAGASSFNQNLGSWDITDLQTGSFNEMRFMLNATALSRENYDATLNGWLSQNVPSNIRLGAGGLEYCASGTRATLMNTYGWDISGDSLAPDCPPDADAGISSVMATSPHQADGVDEAEVTIVLRDDSNQPISGFTDGDFTVTLTGSATASAVAETVTNGTYTFTVTNNVPETVTVTIFAGDTELDDQPEIVFESSVNPNSPVTATTAHKADGLDAATVSVELRDASNQPVSGFTDGDFEIQVTGSALASSVSESATPGTYTFTVTNTVKEVVTITVTAGGTELNANPEIAFLQDMEPFITTWQTDGQILIPVETSGVTYDYDIYWEKTDNSSINGTITGVTGDGNITVPETGTYRVEIYGEFPQINFGRFNVTQTNKDKLQTVEQWGEIEWESMDFAFYGATNLEINATDAPDLNNVTSLEGMFGEAVKVNSDLNHWDVSNIENMRRMFQGKFDEPSAFNGNISNWNVGNVTDMQQMFQYATSFNRDISGWDVNKVENMAMMFERAESFNQDIGYDPVAETGWDVSSVTDMGGMFFGATVFNRDIGGWDVSSVRNFGMADGFSAGGMFEDAVNFNQDLSNWDITAVTGNFGENMFQMFDRSGLSRENYDALLMAWSDLVDANDGPKNLMLGASGLTYCAETARSNLIDNHDWDIDGDTLAGDCGFTPVVSASNSEVTATSPHLADGVDTSVVTVVLVDEDDDPIIGLVDDDFEIGLTGSAVASEVAETDTAGTYEFTVTNTEEETVTLTVTANGVQLDDQPAVLFEAPVQLVDAENSEVTATSPHLADGVDTSDVTVVLRDEDDQPITGFTNDDFLVELTGSAVASEVEETDTAGTYEFTVTNTEEETVTVTVTANGVQLNDQPEITFEAVAIVVDASASSVSATTPHIADGVDASLVDIELLDEDGDPVSGLADTYFSVSLSGSGSASEVTETDTPGTYHFELTSTQEGQITITITALGTELDDKPVVEFEAPEQVVSASNSEVTATSPHLADGVDTSVVTVVLRDEDDDPIIGLVDDDFEIGLTGSAVASEVEETDTAGTYEFTITNTEEETVTVTVTADGVQLDDQPAITFEAVAIVVDVSASSVSATTPHIADGVDSSLITMKLLDKAGDPITELSGTYISVDLSGSGAITEITETDTPGTYTFGLTRTEEGKIQITVTVLGEELGDRPVVEFEAPEQIVDANASEIAVTEVHIADGIDASTVTVWLLDEKGNPVAGLSDAYFGIDLTGDAIAGDVNEVKTGIYQFEVTNTTAEIVVVTVTAQGVQLADQRKIIFEAPEQMVNPKSSIFASSPHLANGVDASVVEMKIIDTNENLIYGLKNEHFSVENIKGLSVSDVKETGNTGIYRFSVTSTVSGTYGLAVTVSGVKLAEQAIIVFEEDVQVVSEEFTEVYATSPHLADGEDASTITIILRDVEKELIAGKNPDEFSIETGNSAAASSVTEAEPGTYTFEVTSTQAGSVEIGISVGETELGNLPTIEFEPVPAPVPDPPVITTLEQIESGVLVEWILENTIDVVRYHIYKGSSVQELQKVAEAQIGTNSYTDSDFNGGAVFYAISAVNSDEVEGRLSAILSYFNSSIIASETEWRLVSVSLKNSVQNHQNTTLYGFSNQYELSSEMVPAQGYWIKSNTYSPESIPVSGSGLMNTTIELNAGWNLIGSLSGALAISDIHDPDQVLVGAPVYGFTPQGYESVEFLEPNQGYWLYAGQSGDIELEITAEDLESESLLASAKANKNINTAKVEMAEPEAWLEFSNQKQSQKIGLIERAMSAKEEVRYLLPPVPPGNVLDVRSVRGTSLVQDKERIRIQAGTWPIHVSVHGLDAESEYVWRLTLQNPGEEQILDILPGKSAMISKAYDHIEISKIHVDEIITEHKLFPNYPNPFNPSTTLQYQIREQTHVSIEIYDTVGRRVQVLRNEMQTSGMYSVQFNASHLSSGLYFVRFRAGSELQIQKMTLVK